MPEATYDIEKAPVEPDSFTREEAKEAVKAVKEQPKESEWETWWSRLDPKHMLMVRLRDEFDSKKPLTTTYVVFDRYRLDIGQLPVSDFIKKEIQRALHDSGREGRDIYVLGKAYAEGESNIDDIELMKTLRELAESFDGVEKIKGLFSNKELIENGINPYTRDVDELIMLALRTKNIKGKVSSLGE
tara:strand:+ start:190 stop:750 length:561 start_codon:yes stop_codon:yes gene_type:complete